MSRLIASAAMDYPEAVVQAMQLALALVFGSAVAAKLTAPRAFTRSLADYALLPSRAVPAAAVVVVVSEVMLAIAFASGSSLRVAAVYAASLLSVFALAVGINLLRGRRTSCGCFGSEEQRISGWTLARLALLAVFAMAVVYASWTERGMRPLELLRSGQASSVFEELALAVFLVAVTAWVVRIPFLVSVMTLALDKRETSR